MLRHCKQFVLFFGLISVFSCEDKSSSKKNENIGHPTLTNFKMSRNLWYDKNINDYDFTLDVYCYCLPLTMKIKVRNNIIVQINDQSFSKSMLSGKYWFAKTINDLFIYIDETISNDPFYSTLKFNDFYGYPAEIYFDISEFIADEEIGFNISSFKER